MSMRVDLKTQPAAISGGSMVAFSSGNELLPFIQLDNNLLIDAELLHRKLKSKGRFRDWISYRIKEYEFEENKDFFAAKKIRTKRGGQNALQYLLTIDMAKELAMLERNETGRNIRRYFIAKEKELRGMVQLPASQQLFKGIKANPINGRKLYPYREMLVRCGYKANSNGNRRHRYPQHFVMVGNILFITEDYALHLHHQKQVFNNRIRLREMQPVLPLNFGEPIKGGA